MFEPWTITVEVQKRIRAMKMKFHGKILRISYEDLVTDEESCATMQQVVDYTKTS